MPGLLKRKRPRARFTRLKRTRRLTRLKRTTRKFRPAGFKGGIVRDRRIVTLRYSTNITIDVGTVIAFHKFRANGLYDPDSTGAGHQPRGFDQFMTLYNKWLVLSSRIRIAVVGGDTTEPYFLGIRVQDDADANPVSMDGFIEKKGTATYRIGTGKSQHPVRMAISANQGKWYNKTRANLIQDFSYQGVVNADPPEQLLFTLAGAKATAADGGTLDVHVIIDYQVMMLEPIIVGGS